MVDLSLLKYRERDSLEGIFKSWDEGDKSFDVVSLRDHRLRYYYGERYDSKKNVLDWDYQTRVKKVASIIHIRQYREWRDSGIAFEFGDATYNVPNRSTQSYTTGMMKGGKDRGIKKEVKGYWLDIIVSPYVAFSVGVEPVNQVSDYIIWPPTFTSTKSTSTSTSTSTTNDLRTVRQGSLLHCQRGDGNGATQAPRG